MGKKLPEAELFHSFAEILELASTPFSLPSLPSSLPLSPLCAHLHFGGGGGEMPVDLTVTIVPLGVSSFDQNCLLPTEMLIKGESGLVFLNIFAIGYEWSGIYYIIKTVTCDNDMGTVTCKMSTLM